jgi:hypothetical protein
VTISKFAFPKVNCAASGNANLEIVTETDFGGASLHASIHSRHQHSRR